MRAASRAIDWINEWTGNVWVCLAVLLLITVDVLIGWSVGAFSRPDWSNLNGAFSGIISIILLVFLQHSSNRGNAAVQLKLDQLILSNEQASNDAVNSEALPEVQIKKMKDEALAQVQDVVENVVEKEK